MIELIYKMDDLGTLAFIRLQQKLMIYKANTFHTQHLTKKAEPFIREGYCQENNDPKTPRSNNSIVNSRHSLKLSFISSTENANANTNANNKTIDYVRNSCFVGNTFPQRQQQSKNFSNLNNSFRFSECIPNSPLEQARRKSESIHIKNIGSGLKTVVSKEMQMTQNTDGVINLIEELQKRVNRNQQEISKLYQINKKTNSLQGELKELKAKLLELTKSNYSNVNEFDCQIKEQNLRFIELRQRIGNFNPSEYGKKYNILQLKLNQLYQGFKIREEYNERQMANHINNLDMKAKEYVNSQTFKINLSLDALHEQFTGIQGKITKIQAEFTQKMKELTYESKKSNKRSQTFIMIDSKKTITMNQDESKSKQPFFQTPKKIHIDTPLKIIAKEPQKAFTVKQQRYFIDNQGFLLDQDHFYLLNSKNQQILLPSQLIDCLKQNGIIQNTSPQ